MAGKSCHSLTHENYAPDPESNTISEDHGQEVSRDNVASSLGYQPLLQTHISPAHTSPAISEDHDVTMAAPPQIGTTYPPTQEPHIDADNGGSNSSLTPRTSDPTRTISR
jgi:hypothetical protein